MTRTLASDTVSRVGDTVLLQGWVNSRRDHGKIVFIDLRDRSGLLQVVARPELVEGLGHEDVISITGPVTKRPEKLVNPKIASGTVEVQAQTVDLISKSAELPFPIDTDGLDIDEEVRLKYRYLDLRRERMRRNLVLRHRTVKFIREFMDDKGFIEIETPLLTRTTPEGARDYVVPSRLYPGRFYALPQSPQQYKELLMIAGVERYFQIARALRDEDSRG